MVDRLGLTRNEIIVSILIVAVAAGIYFLTGGDPTLQTDGEPESNLSEEFFTYAAPGEEVASRNVQGARDFAEVNITSEGIVPGRVSTSIGGPVRWENRLDFPVRLSFENVPEDLVVGPGEQEAMRFRSISYYRAFNDETDERVGRGSIVVG